MLRKRCPPPSMYTLPTPMPPTSARCRLAADRLENPETNSTETGPRAWKMHLATNGGLEHTWKTSRQRRSSGGPERRTTSGEPSSLPLDRTGLATEKAGDRNLGLARADASPALRRERRSESPPRFWRASHLAVDRSARRGSRENARLASMPERGSRCSRETRRSFPGFQNGRKVPRKRCRRSQENRPSPSLEERPPPRHKTARLGPGCRGGCW